VSLAENWEEGIRRIANITLELEKKEFRDEIDRKANAVIDAERRLLRQEYLETENLIMKKDYDSGRYFDALSVYRERVSTARDYYDNFKKNYANRFGEEYGPITDLYTVFRKENPESKLEEYAKGLIDQNAKGSIIYVSVCYFSHWYNLDYRLYYKLFFQ
jgi:hypothetical protein